MTGDVLVDDRRFDKAEGSGSGPGRITPIQVNDNVIDFSIEATAAGQPAKVAWRPQTAAVRIQAVQTVEKDGKVVTWIRDLGHGRLYVHGQIPPDTRRWCACMKWPMQLAHAQDLADRSPGTTRRDGQSPKFAENAAAELPARDKIGELPVVATLVSPPFSENARLILKVSHNLHASTLPLLVAAKNGRRTLAEGLRLQHDFLTRAGVDVETISFAGGAGGTRADHVTPREAGAVAPPHDDASGFCRVPARRFRSWEWK